MNFVADENVDAAVVRALREAGHEVTWIAEIEPAATDEQVLNLADEQRAVLVTEDKDFGELVYRRRLATALLSKSLPINAKVSSAASILPSQRVFRSSCSAQEAPPLPTALQAGQ